MKGANDRLEWLLEARDKQEFDGLMGWRKRSRRLEVTVERWLSARAYVWQ